MFSPITIIWGSIQLSEILKQLFYQITPWFTALTYEHFNKLTNKLKPNKLLLMILGVVIDALVNVSLLT